MMAKTINMEEYSGQSSHNYEAGELNGMSRSVSRPRHPAVAAFLQIASFTVHIMRGSTYAAFPVIPTPHPHTTAQREPDPGERHVSL